MMQSRYSIDVVRILFLLGVGGLGWVGVVGSGLENEYKNKTNFSQS